jgi:ATP-dependent DNA helicase DinG
MDNPFTIIGQQPLPNTVEEAWAQDLRKNDPNSIIPVLQTNMDPDITKHFPFPTIREAQSTALATVVESRQKSKKFTLIEAPTGVGKSGIAMATASWAKTQPLPEDGLEWHEGAYVLSTQKTLTKQYMRDFEKDGLLELKGRSNYSCARHNTDCGSAAVFQSDDPEDNCSKQGVCPYSNAKKDFMSASVGVTNFSYYLTETMYAGMLKPRNYLVLDECHNVENQILGFTDTEFTQQRAAELEVTLPILMPGERGNAEVARKWFEDVCYPVMSDYLRSLEASVKEARNDGDRDEAIRLAKKFAAWEQFKKRVDMFTTTPRPEDWIAFSDVNPKTMKGSKNLIIKPLTATLFAEDLMFSKAANIVMMSATILDFRTFMRNLGIDPSQANTMAVPSEFPIENRPIFYKPCGNMGYRTKEQALPNVAAMILKLMQKYSGKKGIIHAQSYANLKYFQEYLTANGQGHRLVTHTNLPGSREDAVNRHCESSEDTVILSPSMTEGLDLKEDLSRFQIIPKVPYPALDPYTKARMDRDPDWYQWQTSLTLIQATGRSVRSKTDKAHTWILDSGFEQFISKNETKLPNWWTDSIEFR